MWGLPVESLHRATDKFYIYDEDDWKHIGVAGFSAQSEDEIVDMTQNRGAGTLLNMTDGSYHTDQYQLYALHYHRWIKDPRRTFNPADATTFIIPYDLATDSAYYRHCAKNKEHKCFDFRKCPLAPRVEELLRKSPWYQRHEGKDHLLVVGMNYAMDHYIMKPKCKSLLLNVCSNCTKIAIDDYSYLHSGDIGIREKGDYWHAVPFPSNFHWSRFTPRPFPWERADNRSILVSYVGSTQSYYNPARRLRGSLVHFCSLHRGDCVHSAYGEGGGRSVFRDLSKSRHNPLEISAKSVFCFQPIGDLMTRKGLFDSLLQGCIPVTFDDLTASVMYTWHWSEEFWRAISVELPFHGVAHRYVDPVDHLRKLMTENKEVVEKKQKMIRDHVFELQYSLDFKFDEVFKKSPAGAMEWINSWPTVVDGGEAPMRDAYDITMDHVLGWHSGKEADFRNATVPECWNGHLDKTVNGGKGKCVVDDEKK
jgi:hypothetical protein